MNFDIPHYLLVALAALAAGFVNAIAGGGTLITFPALIFLGLPPVTANVTSTVALCPGYFGATWAQRGLLGGGRRRLSRLLPVAAAGGLCGGLLLFASGERTFRFLIPYLIFLASLLLAVQGPVRRRLALLAERRGEAAQEGNKDASEAAALSLLGVGAAAVYGGYFGAGMSVVILGVLGLTMRDSLTRLNALKQSIALATNLAAAILFAFSGRVRWLAALVMAVGALAGGILGGRLANRISPSLLRGLVVGLGLALGLYYLLT